MALLRKFIAWYFMVPTGPRPVLKVIAWWEIRRIPYNLLIGLVGIPSFILFALFAFASNKIPPGEDLVEPMAIWFAPIAFNFCYTLGEIAEILFGQIRTNKKISMATFLMKSGMALSFSIVLFPSVFWGFYLLLLKLGVTK